MRSTSLTSIVEIANEAMSAAVPLFVNAQKLAHGGLLLELNFLEIAGQLEQQPARTREGRGCFDTPSRVFEL